VIATFLRAAIMDVYFKKHIRQSLKTVS
jgi:hypothetical protein